VRKQVVDIGRLMRAVKCAGAEMDDADAAR
jgi:hypothetical protein